MVSICTITETETQGAQDTSIVVTVGDGAPVEVDGVTADFVVTEAGTSVAVALTNVFAAEDDSPPTDDETPRDEEDPPGDDEGGEDSLPRTGVTVAATVLAVLVAIALGVALVATRRRISAEGSSEG